MMMNSIISVLGPVEQVVALYLTFFFKSSSNQIMEKSNDFNLSLYL